MSSSTLALGRALTKRIRRADSGSNPSHPPHSPPAHPSGGPINREQISAPVELISTTNVLAYTAPDIRSISNSSSASSLSSGNDDWDLARAFLNTPSTSPEPSSAESSPITAEPNHLSSYFPTPTRTATTAGARKSNSSGDDVPAIPSRALTHTKKAHIAVARHRSLSRSRSDLPPTTLTAPQAITHRTSVEMFNTDASHPFGRELEQVNEVAEDFGVSDNVLDEEEQLLRRKGLKKFAAGDYMMEIEDLYGGVFEDKIAQTAWI